MDVSKDNINEATFTDFAERFGELRRIIGRVILGQEGIVEDLLIVVLAGGHALIEGAPGLGKTRLVRAFSEATQLSFGRVQFTPDLMPADVTGTTILLEDEGKSRFEFQSGPVFTNVLLADEINRATPKTQSSLLEAMQERSVTVSGTVHALPRPFIALATQNPLEMEGTYPLPEAQLDRFLFKLLIERPDAETLTAYFRSDDGTRRGPVGAHFQPRRPLEPPKDAPRRADCESRFRIRRQPRRSDPRAPLGAARLVAAWRSGDGLGGERLRARRWTPECRVRRHPPRRPSRLAPPHPAEF